MDVSNNVGMPPASAADTPPMPAVVDRANFQVERCRRASFPPIGAS
jgi:hypothetical protein